MPSDYISREAVIKLITARYENPEICTQEINQIPTAHVEPVVHCSECEYFDPSNNQCYRPNYTEDGTCYAEPNGGCTYGNRKDGNSDG
jgi:hypothetical protein